MKKINLLNLALVMFLSFVIITGCKKEVKEVNVPTKMTITIPSSLNQPGTTKSAKAGVEPLKGNDIYSNLRLFIGVGAGGAKIIDDIIFAVKVYNLTSLKSPVSFRSAQDGNIKTLTVSENGDFHGTTYEWKMVITDEGGAKALELFFNTNPVKGVAIYQASKLNHEDWFSKVHPNAIVQIEYSEAEQKYEKQMIVSIAGLQVITANGLNNMKLFVGQNGDKLDIFGNSNHPTCIIFDNSHQNGRDWAFVAHTNTTADVSVAQVALPETTVDVIDANFWTNYNIKKVLNDEIQKVYNGSAPQNILDEYLQNAEAPGYFKAGVGFVSSGTNVPADAAFTPALINLSDLTPYIPVNIKNMTLPFSSKK
jgi:hypothetical protein